MFVRTLLIHQSYTKRVCYVYHLRVPLEIKDTLVADPGQDVLVDLARSLQVREVARILDHDHSRGRGEEAFGATGQLRRDAAVGGPVQVEGGQRRLAPDGLFLGRVPG